MFLSKTLKNIGSSSIRGIECKNYNLLNQQIKSSSGDLVFDKLKSNEITGLTGLVKFDSNGNRKNFKVIIHKTGLNTPIKKVITYKTNKY